MHTYKVLVIDKQLVGRGDQSIVEVRDVVSNTDNPLKAFCEWFEISYDAFTMLHPDSFVFNNFCALVPINVVTRNDDMFNVCINTANYNLYQGDLIDQLIVPAVVQYQREFADKAEECAL